MRSANPASCSQSERCRRSVADAGTRHAVLLAGGRGSRLGGAKPLALLGGRPLVEWPLEAVVAAGLEPWIAAKSDTSLPPDLSQRGVSVLTEPDEPAHPLAGVAAALRAIQAPIVVCACDMPFVSQELLKWLAAQAGAPVVAPFWQGRTQSVLARYEPAALDAIDRAIANGDSAAAALSDAGARLIDADELERFGDPARTFFDIDTPADLEAAESLIA